MTGEKSEKEKRLNYKIQPFPRRFFNAISNVQLLVAKYGHASFSLKPL